MSSNNSRTWIYAGVAATAAAVAVAAIALTRRAKASESKTHSQTINTTASSNSSTTHSHSEVSAAPSNAGSRSTSTALPSARSLNSSIPKSDVSASNSSTPTNTNLTTQTIATASNQISNGHNSKSVKFATFSSSSSSSSSSSTAPISSTFVKTLPSLHLSFEASGNAAHFAYLHLDFDVEVPQISVSSVHASFLQSALVQTCDHLFVGFHLPLHRYSLAQLNSLIGKYYSFASAFAYGHGKSLDFQITFLFPTPNASIITEFNSFLTVNSNSLFAEKYSNNWTLFLAERVAENLDIDTVFVKEGDVKNTSFIHLITKLEKFRQEKMIEKPQYIELKVISSTTPATSVENSANAVSANASVGAFSFDGVVVGGTFDHLHVGHKVLLTACALLTHSTLVIGLTSDVMLHKKKFRETIESWTLRRAKLYHFFSSYFPHVDVRIYILNDMYGPSVTVKQLECLVVSEETANGGKAVNEKRVKENGLNELDVVTVYLAHTVENVSAETNLSAKISSTDLREYALKKRSERDSLLKKAWMTLNLRLKVSLEVNMKFWSFLQTHYNESHRAYHTLQHIHSFYQRLQNEMNYDVKNGGKDSRFDAVELAIWFHDVIYVTQQENHSQMTNGTIEKHSNEELSEQAFQQYAQAAKLNPDLINNVSSIIRSTENHFQRINQLTEGSISNGNGAMNGEEKKDWTAEELFLDYDLSILASDSLTYWIYSHDIRVEYVQVPLNTFRQRRGEFLKKILTQKRYFAMKNHDKKWHGRVKDNLQKEMERLNDAKMLSEE